MEGARARQSPFAGAGAADASVEDAAVEVEGVDPLSARVFQAYMRALNLHRQLLFRTMASEGRHPGQAMCVRLLARNEGISQRDLAALMHLSPPTVTSLLQRLQKAGMVVRWSDDVDQRLTRVALTQEGRRMATDVRAAFSRTMAGSFDGMTDEDRVEFERLLDVFSENVARHLKEPAP